jgi:hypothetical protein
MAGWKSSWNSLAVRLMLSFVAVMVIVTVVFSVSPYVFVKETLESQMEDRGRDRLKRMSYPISKSPRLGTTPPSIRMSTTSRRSTPKCLTRRW